MKKMIGKILVVIMLLTLLPTSVAYADESHDFRLGGVFFYNNFSTLKAGDALYLYYDVTGTNYSNPQLSVSEASGTSGLSVSGAAVAKNRVGVHRFVLPNDIHAGQDNYIRITYFENSNPGVYYKERIASLYTFEWGTENGKKILWSDAAHTKKVVDKSLNLNGVPLYFDKNGYLATGLYDRMYGSSPMKCYSHPDGRVHFGWQKIDDKWYYFGSDFSFEARDMVKNTIFTTSTDGKTYGFDSNGVMLTNTTKTSGGKTYNFGPDGAVVANYTSKWVVESGTRYYKVFEGSSSTGVGISGWHKIDGYWYHFSTGTPEKEWQLINGTMFYFDKDGKMVTNTTIDGIKIGPDGIVVGDSGTPPTEEPSPSAPPTHDKSGDQKLPDDGKGGDSGSNTDSTSTANNIAKSPKDFSIKLPDVAYTGSSLSSKLTIKHKGKTLTKGIDYTVTYKDNKNIGKGTATIKGIGKYSGTKTITFKVNPKQTSILKAKVGKNRVTLTWKKVPAAQKITKFQVRFREKGKAKWTTKTLSPKKNILTIKSLKKNKIYQFQVRSYKKITSGKSKGTYTSAWSKTKTSTKIK